MAIFPDPTFSVDWREWARRLISVLDAEDGTFEDAPTQLPHYSVSNLPQAAQDGLLIWVVGETGGDTVAVSRGGNWRRVYDMVVVS